MRLLLVEDDHEIAAVLQYMVKRYGHLPVLAHSYQEALERFQQDDPEAALLDIRLPDGNGIDLLKQFRRSDPEFPAVMATGEKDLETAVEAMKAGAMDYLTKPVEPSRLEVVLGHMDRFARLRAEVRALREQTTPRDRFESIVGRSPAMQTVYSIIENVARSSATVLITGESGTGKELVAQAIHARSPRADHAMIEANCAAFAPTLLESELFGHEKGAFTGADRRHIGCFERAHRGTLFLDEISEMDLALQAKLLRVLQEQAFFRVGGHEKIHVDVRIVAATNRNPLEMVDKGRFRQDLYYRINVVPIRIPPLHERGSDIILLARHFLAEFAEKNRKKFEDFERETVEILCSYAWPGNVRELRNAIEQIVVLNNGKQVTTAMIPDHVRQVPVTEQSRRLAEQAGHNGSGGPDAIQPMWKIEKREIARALDVCGWNVKDAARRLEVSPATLYRRIDKLNLKPEPESAPSN